MLTSFACEPLLTGLGAGGYMLVVEPGRRPGAARLLRRGARARGGRRRRGPSWSRSASRSATRSRCSTSGRRRWGRTGCRPGCARRRRRFGRMPLAELVAPAARLARDGVELNDPQAYVIEILAGIVTSTPECAALFAPGRAGGAGRRRRPPARAGRRARAARGGGPGAVLHRRHRGGDRRVAGRARRDRHRRGPGRLRGGRPRADPGRLPRPRGGRPIRRRRPAGS